MHQAVRYASIAAILVAPSHTGAASCSVTVTNKCVTVNSGGASAAVRLTDSVVEFTAKGRTYVFTPYLMGGTGWVRPTRTASSPEVTRGRGWVRVKIDFTVEEHREFVMEIEAYEGVPAVFVTSRLKSTRGTTSQYYFWAWNASFSDYCAGSDAGIEHARIDASRPSRLGYRDWHCFPAEGGLLLMSRGNVGRDAGENGNGHLWPIPRSKTISPGDSHTAGFGLAIADGADQAVRLWSRIRSLDAPALRRSPETDYLRSLDYGAPAPEWLRNAESYNGFYHAKPAWNRENIREKLSHFPLIVGVPHDKAVIDRCHRAGIRVIPYVNYMELLNTRIEREARGRIYYEWTQSARHDELDLANHADWIVIGREGEPVNSVWGANNGHPGLFYTCFHQTGLQEAALRQVRRLMEMGADGVFIDNAGPVAECFGNESGKHTHSDSSSTNTQMYESLQRRIYELVKSYGQDKIVMQNSGIIPSHWRYSDAQMWEACIYGSGTRERLHEWEEMKYAAEATQQATKHGKVPVVLPYFSGQPPDRRADRALYTYAYARIFDFLWADWFTLEETKQAVDTAKEVYSLRLGEPRGGVRLSGRALYRMFANGVVALNPSTMPEKVRLALPRSCSARDVGKGELQVPVLGRVRIEIAPDSAKVIIWK